MNILNVLKSQESKSNAYFEAPCIRTKRIPIFFCYCFKVHISKASRHPMWKKNVADKEKSHGHGHILLDLGELHDKKLK